MGCFSGSEFLLQPTDKQQQARMGSRENKLWVESGERARNRVREDPMLASSLEILGRILGCKLGFCGS